MNFQTQISLSKETRFPIDYKARLLLLGSCFSENIGNKLKYYKFSSVQNPFGILFHPKAIESLLENAINAEEFTEEDIFNSNEGWHSFAAHSQLSSTSQEKTLQKLNQAIKITQKQLVKSTHIIITLGTSWVYRHIASDTVVANCHKIPQKEFLKELLSIEDIAESLESMIALVRDVNPNIQFIFTVSPVRHLKDGFIENQRSKAHLISAIHQVISPRKRIFYFPSYEIMMDELRDYRFYAGDMIHPNQTAIHYIWEQFLGSWISEFAIETMSLVDSIQKRLQHRAFNPNSSKHQKFLEKISLDIQTIQKEFPNIIF